MLELKVKAPQMTPLLSLTCKVFKSLPGVKTLPGLCKEFNCVALPFVNVAGYLAELHRHCLQIRNCINCKLSIDES